MALPINRRLCRWQPLKILTGEACATPQCVENMNYPAQRRAGKELVNRAS
jgi:hypothetical protein